MIEQDNFFKKHLYSIAYYSSVVLLILTWFVFEWGKGIRIISNILFLLAAFNYNMEYEKNKIELMSSFMKAIRDTINVLNFLIMSSLTVIYIFISVGELEKAALTLMFVFFIIIIASTTINIKCLYKSNKLWPVIYFYLTTSLLIVFLFSTLYSVTTGEAKGLTWNNDEGKQVTNLNDFMFFSSSVYYSNVDDTFVLIGNTRWFMIAELALSVLVHYLALGFAVSNLKNGQDNSPVNI